MDHQPFFFSPMKKFSIIITAGGIGKRMGAELPKQFIEIDGKAILLHTLERIHGFFPDQQIILTLPAEWKDYWNNLLVKYACTIPHSLVDGGEERYHSIKNALSLCTGDFIFIHDGVRPLVNEATLQRCVAGVEEFGQVIPVISVKESLRKKENTHSIAVLRSDYLLVQTPQCFSQASIRRAYEIAFHTGITDDASLVEEAGFTIHLVDGNEENIKITTQNDLLIAELLLRQRSKGSEQ